MQMSEQTDKIFAAVSKMQAELTNASKDKQGHGYKYADLAECIETAKAPLAANGLAVVQLMGMADSKHTITTMLTHESGQYVCDTMRVEDAVLQGGAGKNPAQVMGASITYMRRYAFAAIIGLAQEDDDAANVRKREKEAVQDVRKEAKANNADPASDSLRKAFFAKMRERHSDDRDKILHELSEFFQRAITSSNELTQAEMREFLNALEAV